MLKVISLTFALYLCPYSEIFPGGDIATGAATVILAMGAGKRAARAIDKYLKLKK